MCRSFNVAWRARVLSVMSSACRCGRAEGRGRRAGTLALAFVSKERAKNNGNYILKETKNKNTNTNTNTNKK